ncbi:hypothetical protein NL676_013836 [Syzygium grande]|nr:hypothetical protein NL676_013836 [Syzygium grande]
MTAIGLLLCYSGEDGVVSGVPCLRTPPANSTLVLLGFGKEAVSSNLESRGEAIQVIVAVIAPPLLTLDGDKGPVRSGIRAQARHLSCLSGAIVALPHLGLATSKPDGDGDDDQLLASAQRDGDRPAGDRSSTSSSSPSPPPPGISSIGAASAPRQSR